MLTETNAKTNVDASDDTEVLDPPEASNTAAVALALVLTFGLYIACELYIVLRVT